MFEFLRNIYYKVYVSIDRSKDQILWRSQRFIRGYATIDAWYVDYWFTVNCLKMLKEIKEKNRSIPAYFLEDVLKEERDPTEEESEKAYAGWMGIIERMIELLEEMKKDPKDDEDFKRIDRCKDEFFVLFSKYFWMIGY